MDLSVQQPKVNRKQPVNFFDKMITVRKGVRFPIYELDLYVELAVKWMQKKYPTINFGNVDYIFSANAARARYFPNEVPSEKYPNPTVFVATNRKDVLLYWKPSLGMVRDCVKGVGYGDCLMTQLVHELTHHVQYQQNQRKGNELDTTANELEWLKENRPDVYELFMNVKPKK